MRPLRILAAASVLVAVLVHAPLASGEKAGKTPAWPEFHGVGRTNISPETGLLKKWPEGGPRLVWKYADCGQGYSGVSIAEGKIFTVGDFDEGEMLMALDLDGKLLWKARNGGPWRGNTPGSRTTPTYNDGLLYQMTAYGRLGAFDAQTGREVWAVDLKKQFDAEWGIWALAENVVVDEDKVISMPGGPKGRVVALDKRTGKTLWVNTQIEHSAAYCSPRVITHGGVRQWISMTQKSVVGVDVRSGKLLWTHPFVPKSPQNATTPEYHDGCVFVAGGHAKGGCVFQIAPDSTSTKEIWSRWEVDNCHGGVIYHDQKLYGCGCRLGGRNFFCIDFLTGKPVQIDKTLSKVGITCAEGMLYCLNHRGKVSLLEMTRTGFTITSQFDLPKRPDNTYLAHPVICGGRLYLRCDENLWAFDVRAR